MRAGELADVLAARLRGRVDADRPLAGLTTYRLGGPARVYVEPVDVADVAAVADVLGSAPDTPVLVLGRGSNLVVSDRGWPGVVIRLGAAFARVETQGAAVLRAGAATPLPTVASRAARRGLTGLEFGVAIPGSIGGAVRMNAGAHDGCMAGALRSATVFDLDAGAPTAKLAADLGLGYRSSSLGDRDLVLDVELGLESAEPGAIRARMESFRRHRAATQPGALQNAGSVFKNPSGHSAGRLVEAAGLKGLRVGRAAVSELHANFFLASDGATAQDVYDLVSVVRTRVHEACGIDLEPEIRFAGAFESRSRDAVMG